MPTPRQCPESYLGIPKLPKSHVELFNKQCKTGTLNP